ncbi:MAG: TIGR03857 family LLM class F420-dependent oxidoreductase [Gammaproteobacteria bacterium]|nr:TIGR03857 family LLM class F420-dependent oxidoreductase [Gammaproteobacteria bacterium]
MQRFPEFGFYALPGHVSDPTTLTDEVRDGQALGLGTVWISERPGTKDIGVLCGAAQAHAPALTIGTGLIGNLPLRNPLVVASFCSTMVLMTKGRFVLGVGHGQDRLADLAGAPRSTRPIIGRYLAVLRRLWNGEVVSVKGDNWMLEKAALGLKLPVAPPIFMAAIGDKSLAWAGKNCDGVLLFSCLNAPAVARSVEVIRTAALEAGRDPKAVTICAVAVTACDVSEEKQLNYIVRRMSTYFMLPSIDALIRVNGWDTVVAGKIKATVFEQAKAAPGLLGDEGVSRELDVLRGFRDRYPRHWLEECNALGDTASCLRYVRSMFEAGADRVIFHGSPPRDLQSLLAAWRP